MIFHFSVHGPESQYDIQNNNLRKRLANTQKFAFDFVAFLISLSIYIYIYPNPALERRRANRILK